MIELTPDEAKYLLQQPGVAAALNRYNRAQAHQSVAEARRLEHVKRARQFERMAREIQR